MKKLLHAFVLSGVLLMTTAHGAEKNSWEKTKKLLYKGIAFVAATCVAGFSLWYGFNFFKNNFWANSNPNPAKPMPPTPPTPDIKRDTDDKQKETPEEEELRRNKAFYRGFGGKEDLEAQMSGMTHAQKIALYQQKMDEARQASNAERKAADAIRMDALGIAKEDQTEAMYTYFENIPADKDADNIKTSRMEMNFINRILADQKAIRESEKRQK